MINLTWQQLQELIEKSVINKEDPVVIYDMDQGEEYSCNFLEFSENETWKPSLCFSSLEENK